MPQPTNQPTSQRTNQPTLMQIVQLVLENTKSYQQCSVEFTTGVNAIVGHNGAGKSTILEAIGFSLFDCLIGYKQNDFVREGAKSATISVTFISSLDERSYQVIRRCGSTNQHYIFDPELQNKICEGKTDVILFLRQHMGVDPNVDLTRLFADAVGVPQGTFTASFLQTPTQRKTTFDPLLQVEEYKTAFDRLLEPLRLLRDQHKDLAIQIASLEAVLKRLPVLRQAVETRQHLLTETAQTAEQTATQLRLVQIERTQLETVQRLVATLQNRHQQARQQVENLAGQLQGAQRMQAEAQQAHQVVQQNVDGFHAYGAAQTRKQALEAQLRQRQALERQQTKLEKLLATQQVEQNTLLRNLDEVATAEATIAALASAVAEQETMEKALAVAQQESALLEDAKAQRSKQQSTQQRLQQRLQELTAKLAQTQALDNQRHAQIAGIEQLQQVLDEHKEVLAQYKAEADALKQQTSSLEQIATAVCPICEQPLTSEHRHEMLHRNTSRLESLRLVYKDRQQQSKADEQRLRAYQADLQQAEQALRALPRQEEVNAIQQELKAAQSTFDAIDQKVVQFSEAPQRAKKLTENLVLLGNPRQRHVIAFEVVSRRGALTKKLQLIEEEIAARHQEQNQLQQQLVVYKTFDLDLETASQELQRHSAAYQLVLSNRQVADMLPTRTAAVESLQQRSLQANAEVTTSAADLAQAQQEFDAQKYHQLVAHEQALRTQQGNLEARITMLTQEQLREQYEIEQLQQQEEDLAALLTKQQELEKQTATLETLRNLLKQAGPHITQAVIKQISDGAGQIFSEIMQDYSHHLRWQEDYAITLEVDGRERQFAQLSGGEQMSAALAVRLALVREMSNIDIAFFDEPTTNLDETRRESLARQILDVKGFRQLFVISHDDTFEQATQNLIRIARVNGVSTVIQP